MIAEQHELGDDRAGLAVGGREDCRPQFCRINIYAEKISRDRSFRREHDEAARMRVFARFRIVSETKARFTGELRNRRLIGDEKMPACIRVRPAVTREVFFLFRRGNLGRLIWIDADVDDIELSCDIESQFLEGLNQAIVDQGAKHRAMVVTKNEEQWFLAEIIAEPDEAPGGIAKIQIRGNFLAKVLIEPDSFQLVGRERMQIAQNRE